MRMKAKLYLAKFLSAIIILVAMAICLFATLAGSLQIWGYFYMDNIVPLGMCCAIGSIGLGLVMLIAIIELFVNCFC